MGFPNIHNLGKLYCYFIRVDFVITAGTQSVNHQRDCIVVLFSHFQ